jgi:hypothetical protein
MESSTLSALTSGKPSAGKRLFLNSKNTITPTWSRGTICYSALGKPEEYMTAPVKA